MSLPKTKNTNTTQSSSVKQNFPIHVSWHHQTPQPLQLDVTMDKCTNNNIDHHNHGHHGHHHQLASSLSSFMSNDNDIIIHHSHHCGSSSHRHNSSSTKLPSLHCTKSHYCGQMTRRKKMSLSTRKTTISPSSRSSQSRWWSSALWYTILMFASSSLFNHHHMMVVQCDIFSSTAHIQSLMHLERHLVSSLTSYLENVEEKIFQVKLYLSEFAYTAGQHRYAGTYADNLMDNPLQAFQLLKRLAINWNKIERVMKRDSWHEVDYIMSTYRSLMPNHEDLNGAALALVRLQDTYNLSRTDMANGYIYGQNSMIKMSARDCLYLGKSAFNNGYYGLSLEWFEEALTRAHIEGNRTASVEEITPFFNMALEYHDKLENELKENNYPLHSNKLRLLEGDNEDYVNYQKLCRGEDTMISSDDNDEDDDTKQEHQQNHQNHHRRQRRQRHKLNCYYWTNHRHPLLLLRPAKVEQYNRTPLIVMYHDLISDHEIELLKEMATPSLTRARVQTEDNEDEISKVRVSQTAWFAENAHPVLERISARIEAVTGLSVDMDQSNCELVQIANYGMGGHYVPHYDYLIKDRPEEDRKNVPEKEKHAGDRMATFMFYLSNVVNGGATVFTRLGVRVAPVKGAAIFWYNLYRNGEGIIDTVHGACPVLMGEKWVANYWIREHGQIFHRPCGLNPKH